MVKKEYPNLFTPIKIRGTAVKNRIMSAPNMLFHTVDGRPTDFYIGYLEHKARGGAGIVNLGESAVCDGGRHTPPMLMTEDNLPIYAEMPAAIHEHGALASAELTHGGMRSRQKYNAIPIMGPDECINDAGAPVRAMTEEDIESVADAFADAAEYWMRAGFDMVHAHYGHTWIFTQFFSPLLNHRTDRYGGSLENRMRFPLLALKKMRERVGGRMLITIRQSGAELAQGGFTTDDVIEFLVRAQEYIDMAEITTEGWERTMPSTYLPWGLNTGMSEAIKRSGRVSIPIYVVGSILAPEQAEEIIASGKADGVSMSRALIADPYFPLKAKTGRARDIVPCLRCMSCTDNDNANRHLVCSVNPLIGRESRIGFGADGHTAKHPRRVLVVGGGPAGMQAALTAASCGHDVVLCEKSDALGGLLRFTDTDSLKTDLRRYKDYLIEQLGRCGAKVMLNTQVDGKLAGELGPEHIIVATGSAPIIPVFLKGYERARPAAEIYFAPETVRGERIVIIGGGLVGVEAGLHLCNIGKRVTVLEMQDVCAAEAGNTYRRGVMWKAGQLGLEMITRAACREVTAEGVRYEKDGQERMAAADTVFYAVGMKSFDAPYFELQDCAAFVDLIGDGRKVGKVSGAVHSGYFAALDIGVY